ncbi:alpha/beta fold hydrolase [Patulibacter americanus]|uniref:alpha/beta fold hydrolase n=1 Tax=Patulibacter americanus TaxID=588672 RepID=UPI0003B7AF75|nr:alpha/beta fold hydrolase [Patulibacter americanus]
MSFSFTPAHRGGSGEPLVLLHGFMDTWRTWELVLPTLERHHDVLAPTLPGHAGGPPLEDAVSHATMADAVERAMDDAGFETAHVAGNSLGGFVALQLAARGRARSVVALAPAGGWEPNDPTLGRTLAAQTAMHEATKALAPHAGAIAATAAGRRRATELLTSRPERLPADLVAHLVLGVARCDALPMLAFAASDPYVVEAERIDCPVRIVWGTADRLLPWPTAARRLRRVMPQADWIELEGVAHAPQLDVPLETAQLILGHTGG